MTLTPEERARFCNDVATRHPDDYEGIIAAEIRAAVADATRWIPVSERLPAYGDLIELGWTGLPTTIIARFYGVHVFFRATHWRLFSPPPKEQPND